jgi:hypothetical protein
MSCGPMTNVIFIKGIFMANPPYENNLLDVMVDKIIESIDNNNNNNLAFTFGMPHWPYKPIPNFYNKINKSGYNNINNHKHDYLAKCLQIKNIYWENLMTNKLMKIYMTSYRCYFGNNDNNKLIKTFEDIIDYWKKLK